MKAVDDISFDVYPGETVGLVGESGCGKTSVGRAILHLNLPTGGELKFNEKERAGWICGLGHGILKETPEENVKTFVKEIREAFA